MTTRNAFVDEVHASTSVTNADTDGNGDVTVTLSDLRHIEDPADVHAQADAGYTANVQSVSDNTVTIRIFQSAGSAAAHSPVTSGTDVTSLWVSAVGY